jgi:hypothetical protein
MLIENAQTKSIQIEGLSKEKRERMYRQKTEKYR